MGGIDMYYSPSPNLEDLASFKQNRDFYGQTPVKPNPSLAVYTLSSRVRPASHFGHYTQSTAHLMAAALGVYCDLLTSPYTCRQWASSAKCQVDSPVFPRFQANSGDVNTLSRKYVSPYFRPYILGGHHLLGNKERGR